MYFNLDDYKDNRYAMHCKTEEQAEYFCEFLHNAGRKWCDGKSYLGNTSWYPKYNDSGGCCYCFNTNDYGSYKWFQTQGDSYYRILEFENFEWDEFNCKMQVEPIHVDEFLSSFVIN